MESISWPLDAQPQLRQAGRFPLRDRDFCTSYRGGHHGLHLHDYHGVMQLQGAQWPLEPGTLTISPAGGVTRHHLPEAGEHWCIHFHSLERVTAVAGIAELPIYAQLGARRNAFAQGMREIAALFARGKAGDARARIARAAAAARMQELLLTIALLAPDQDGGARRQGRVEHALDQLATLIHERLHEELGVAELAAELGVSQNYLARRFRERFGCTIQRYVLEQRIERARYLLSSTSLPIKRIGEEVGLADPQHFNKQFRRVAGMSPSAARELGW